MVNSHNQNNNQNAIADPTDFFSERVPSCQDKMSKRK